MNQNENPRRDVILAFFKRSEGRRIWGFSSVDGRPEESPNIKFGQSALLKVKDSWDFICAEGDLQWTPLPPVTIPVTRKPKRRGGHRIPARTDINSMFEDDAGTAMTGDAVVDDTLVLH